MNLFGSSKLLKYSIGIGVMVLLLALLQLRGFTGWMTRLVSNLPSPILSPLTSAARGIRHGVSSVTSIRSLYVENGQLKTRVQELERNLSGLQAVAQENEMLRSNLGFAAKPPVSLIPCTVTTRDPEGITQTLLLSCGESEGVRVGHGVTSSGYLVGKVVLITAHTATVRLLTAPTTVTDVRIAGRQIGGVLKGSFGSGLIVDYIPQTAEVQKGDLVTTAGVNALIPPDILIGSVTEAAKPEGALFYNMTVTSPIDLRDIRYVHVLRP